MHKSNDRRVAFGPPRAYWAKTLDNFRELTPALEAAIEEIWKFPDYPESGPDCMQAKYLTMILAGPTGTGKTHCLAGIFNDYRENGGDDAVFRRCIDLGRELSAARPAQLIELLQRYGDGHVIDPADELDTGCEELLLDDLGVGCDQATVDFLIEILDRRTSNNLRTIVTTNLTRKELQELLGERGYSRLMYRCKWVPMPGADYRLEGKP
jgi:DNA replication protein DnaC